MSSDDSVLRPQPELSQRKAWQRFQEHYAELVDPSNPKSVSLYAFLRSKLAQFHLSSSYDPAYVLNEVYIRAHKHIVLKDERIEKTLPWVKSAGFNTIRELNRQSRKSGSLDSIEGWEDHFPTSPEPESDFNPDSKMALVMLAFQKLSPEEQRLLELVTIEELSYQEVRQHFWEEGSSSSEQNLRQRKSRALKRLRKIYHDLDNSKDCNL